MNQFVLFSSISVIVLFLILILVYFKFHFRHGRLEKLVAGTYLCIGFVYWMIHLNSFGGIIDFPHFYRVGGGLWMLSVVLLFYCARIIHNKSITWKEYLHLLPVLIYFINFFPFIMQNAEYKVEIISNVLQGQSTYFFDEGWLLPGKYILTLRVFHRLLIAYLIGMMIFKDRHEDIKRFGYKTIVTYYFWFVFLSSFPELFSIFDINTFQGVLLPSYLYLILGLIFLIMYFISPQLLYGFEVNFEKRVLKIEPDESEDFEEELIDNDFVGEELTFKQRSDIERIESYLQEHRPYLDVNFSLLHLESNIEIHSKKISQTIKAKYNQNFSQFINRRRIMYVLKKLEEDKKWRNYSVEALASNVGFNSPNSFYNYFKNHTGKTPREFIDSLGLKEESTG